MRKSTEAYYKVPPPRERDARRVTRRARIAAKRVFMTSCELLALAAFVGMIGLVTPTRGEANEANGRNTNTRTIRLTANQMERGVSLSVLAGYCGATVNDSALRAVENKTFRAYSEERLAKADLIRTNKDRADVCRVAVRTVSGPVGRSLGVIVTSKRAAQ